MWKWAERQRYPSIAVRRDMMSFAGALPVRTTDLSDEKEDQRVGKFAKELIESMQQAAKHAAGRSVRGLRVSKVEVPDVKAIRLSLRMSQLHFAAAYRIPLPTLKNWEQGRRMPDAPAAAYLLAIKRRPKLIMEAVARP
jgi:putative transcriptional regulator